MDHDDTQWRSYKRIAPDGYSTYWIIESDLRHCMAKIELSHVSKSEKEYNPNWETEFNNDLRQVQANVNLMEAAPTMLEALIAAKNGDMSLIEKAIDRATGKIDWLGFKLDENGNRIEENRTPA